MTGGRERLHHYADRRDIELDNETVGAIHAAKNRLYRERVAAGAVALRPGIQRLLDAAREAGLKLAIATTSGRENVEALLRATLGADGPGRFAVIAAGDAVAHKKPAPDIYRLALSKLDLAAGAALAIEDSAAGLAAARGAGICTVITLNEFTRGEEFGAAARVLEHLDDDGAGRPVDIGTLRQVHRACGPATR